MLPETFWGRIGYLLQQYGTSFLSGAGNTMIIAIVGTFLGCLIGFIVGIIQTIPVDQRDSAVKRTLVGILKFIMEVPICSILICPCGLRHFLLFLLIQELTWQKRSAVESFL